MFNIKNFSITKKVTGIISLIIFFTLVSTTLVGYYYNYQEVKKAAGIELYGCANITIGLLNSEDINGILISDGNSIKIVENQLNWTVHQKDIFDTQYIIGLDGKLLAVDNQLKAEGYNAGQQYYIDPKVVQTIVETKMPYYSDVYTYEDQGKRITGYAPIFKNGEHHGEVIALNAIDFRGEIVQERAIQSLSKTMIAISIVLILGCILLIIFINRLIKPLIQLSKFSQVVASGDLSQPSLPVKNSDEINRLTNDMNEMVSKLKTLIKKVDTNSDEVKETANLLVYKSDEIGKASEAIAEYIQDVAEGTEQQLKLTTNVSESTRSILQDYDNLSTNIEYIKNESITNSENANLGQNVIMDVKQQMNQIKDNNNQVRNQINELYLKSKDIEDMVTLITEFANQTNLLSLNASIEAARAGEEGRGFSVVAGEIKKLAEKSKSSAEHISELVNDIHKHTQLAKNSATEGTKQVNQGLQYAEQAESTFINISNSVNGISNDIQNFYENIHNMSISLKNVYASVNEISEIAFKNSGEAQGVAAASEEQTASLQEFIASINILSQMADDLKNSINSFKI